MVGLGLALVLSSLGSLLLLHLEMKYVIYITVSWKFANCHLNIIEFKLYVALSLRGDFELGLLNNFSSIKNIRSCGYIIECILHCKIYMRFWEPRGGILWLEMLYLCIEN